MDDLIEKVARAICKADGGDPNLTLGGDGENFLWHEYEPHARAALAVAEPELRERHARIAEKLTHDHGKAECCGYGVNCGDHEECCGIPNIMISGEAIAAAIRTSGSLEQKSKS